MCRGSSSSSSPPPRSSLEALKRKFSGVHESTWRYGIELVKAPPPLAAAAASRGKSGELSQAVNKAMDAALSSAARRQRGAPEPPWRSVEFARPWTSPDSDVRRSSRRPKKKTAAYFESTGPGRTKCALCGLFFRTESVVGSCCNKHVLDLRGGGRERLAGRRFKTPSFLYQEVRVCRFCTQIATDPSRRQDEEKGSNEAEGAPSPLLIAHHDTALEDERSFGRLLGGASDDDDDDDTEATQRRRRRRRLVAPPTNLALRGEARQSSTVDGRVASMAVDGSGFAEQGSSTVTCTRRELEAWWECRLSTRAAAIGRVSLRFGGRIRRGATWILIADSPLGRARLGDARKLATRAMRFGHDQRVVPPSVGDGDDPEVVTWEVEGGPAGALVRVQVEGTRALQLAEVVVEPALHAVGTGDDLSHHRLVETVVSASSPSSMAAGFRGCDESDADEMTLRSGTHKHQQEPKRDTSGALCPPPGSLPPSTATTSRRQSKGSGRGGGLVAARRRPATSHGSCCSSSGGGGGGVVTRSSVGGACVRPATRELVSRPVQPSDVSLSRIARSRTLGAVADGLRRHKSSAYHDDGSATNRVDQLYWRAVLRYELRSEAAAATGALLASFSHAQLNWARALFALCRAQAAHEASGVPALLRRPALVRLGDDLLNRGVSRETTSLLLGGGAGDDHGEARVADERDAESGSVDLRVVYACLRRLSERLVVPQSSGDDDDAFGTIDAASIASVARDVCALGRFDDADASLRRFTTSFTFLEPQPASNNKRRQDQVLPQQQHPADDVGDKPTTMLEGSRGGSSSATDLGLVPQADVEMARLERECPTPLVSQPSLVSTSGVASLSSSSSSSHRLQHHSEELSLAVSWHQFLAILGVARDRGRGTRREADDVVRALGLESDETAADPGAAQRRRTRGLVAQGARRPRGGGGGTTRQAQREREDAPSDKHERALQVAELCGSPTVSLRGSPSSKLLPTRLATAESRFRLVAKRLDDDDDDQCLGPRGGGLSSSSSKALVVKGAPPTAERSLDRGLAARPATATLKSCGLCLLQFPAPNMAITASLDLVQSLLARFGLDPALAARGGSRPRTPATTTLRLARLPICRFCSQFFDCDQPDGLAATRLCKPVTKNDPGDAYDESPRGPGGQQNDASRPLEPFFDLRYPTTPSSPPAGLARFSVLRDHLRSSASSPRAAMLAGRQSER